MHQNPSTGDHVMIGGGETRRMRAQHDITIPELDICICEQIFNQNENHCDM